VGRNPGEVSTGHPVSDLRGLRWGVGARNRGTLGCVWRVVRLAVGFGARGVRGRSSRSCAGLALLTLDRQRLYDPAVHPMPRGDELPDSIAHEYDWPEGISITHMEILLGMQCCAGPVSCVWL
jgi:hypothetical protein